MSNPNSLTPNTLQPTVINADCNLSMNKPQVQSNACFAPNVVTTAPAPIIIIPTNTNNDNGTN